MWVALYFTVCALNNEKVLVNIRKLRIAFLIILEAVSFWSPLTSIVFFPKTEVDGNRQISYFEFDSRKKL